jgi:hypothetical protein
MCSDRRSLDTDSVGASGWEFLGNFTQGKETGLAILLRITVFAETNRGFHRVAYTAMSASTQDS